MPQISQINNNSKENIICKNCGNSFIGNYCNICGQKANTFKLNYREFILDSLNAFNFEKGLLYTFKELTLRPGVTIREYIKGKRQYHYGPLQYLLITLAIATALSLFFKISLEPITNDLNKVAEFTFKNSVISFFLVFFNKYLEVSLLGVIPFISFYSKRIYRLSRLNYTEHLVLNLYIFGHIVAIYIILTPLNTLSNGLFFLAFFICAIPYLIWSYYRFFFIGIKGIFRTIYILIISYIVYAVFIIILLLIYCIITNRQKIF
jgi:hypothetical protein